MMYHLPENRFLARISVVPFQDRRPAREVAPAAAEPPAEGETAEQGRPVFPERQGSYAMGWFPLMPYAWVSRELPESQHGSLATLRSFWCQFDRELAEAAAVSLQASGFFSGVESAENMDGAQTRYVFLGSVRSTKYEGSRITYGLTYLAAPCLWLLGFPTAVSHNHLEVTFRIYDKTEQKDIWRYRYSGDDRTVHFLYAQVGDDASGYAFLMKQAMNSALHDLRQKLEH